MYITRHSGNMDIISVNKLVMSPVKLSQWRTNLGISYPCVSFLASSIDLSMKSLYKELALAYRINWEVNTPYEDEAEILLFKSGKLTIGRLKSSRLSYIFVFNIPCMSNSRKMSTNEAEQCDSVVSLISSSGRFCLFVYCFSPHSIIFQSYGGVQILLVEERFSYNVPGEKPPTFRT